ncbi:hypothetical protein F2Q69_00026875 [Brassica cretica]|uniref:Uncharacterized protein n=1 Tax=Brassica cretica TaxID=69181 RepID=A0A8S9S1Q0_BRACR|nr:hypothetical protein F2Q69_00026875 [Brassica cretica]
MTIRLQRKKETNRSGGGGKEIHLAAASRNDEMARVEMTIRLQRKKETNRSGGGGKEIHLAAASRNDEMARVEVCDLREMNER